MLAQPEENKTKEIVYNTIDLFNETILDFWKTRYTEAKFFSNVKIQDSMELFRSNVDDTVIKFLTDIVSKDLFIGKIIWYHFNAGLNEINANNKEVKEAFDYLKEAAPDLNKSMMKFVMFIYDKKINEPLDSLLTETELSRFKRYAQGLTYQQIATEDNVKRASVIEMIRKANKKILDNYSMKP